MDILVALGDIYGASKLVDITSAQVSGVSYKTIGQAGLEYLEDLASEEFEYSGINELNDILENKYHYISSLRNAMLTFQNENIAGKKIYGVFLTGGASRMGFVFGLIKDTYGLSDKQVRIDPDNPSLTISFRYLNTSYDSGVVFFFFFFLSLI